MRPVSRTPAISRIERGAAPYVSIRRVATVASIVGLRLSVRAYPAGPPLRDAAQIALLARLRELTAPRPDLAYGSADPDREAIFGRGTRRSRGRGWTAYVDAETRIRDAQALERRTCAQAARHAGPTGSSCSLPTRGRTGRCSGTAGLDARRCADLERGDHDARCARAGIRRGSGDRSPLTGADVRLVITCDAPV